MKNTKFDYQVGSFGCWIEDRYVHKKHTDWKQQAKERPVTTTHKILWKIVICVFYS